MGVTTNDDLEQHAVRLEFLVKAVIEANGAADSDEIEKFLIEHGAKMS